MNRLLNPFNVIWFISEIRTKQSRDIRIKLMRNLIKDYSLTYSIIAFLSLFSNFIMFSFLSFFGVIGFIEIILLLYAIIKGTSIHLKRKAKRNLIWKN